jgi:hypothetical protein
LDRVPMSRAILSSTLPTLERFTPQSLLSSLRVGGRPLIWVRYSISARRASFLSARADGGGFSVIGISALRERRTRRIELVLTSVVPQSLPSSARVGGRPRLSVSCLALAHRASSKELGTLLIAIADHASRKIVRPPWSGIARVNNAMLHMKVRRASCCEAPGRAWAKSRTRLRVRRLLPSG